MSEYRDATDEELRAEHEVALEAMSRGELGVTTTTRERAAELLAERRADVDTTHECPAPGCEERLPFETFACRSHWYAIPKALRDSLWRAWRRGDLEAHSQIREDCVAFLEGRRS